MPAPWLALLAQGDAQLQKGGVSWLAASFLLKQLTVPREELPLTEERQRADGGTPLPPCSPSSSPTTPREGAFMVYTFQNACLEPHSVLCFM